MGNFKEIEDLEALEIEEPGPLVLTLGPSISTSVSSRSAPTGLPMKALENPIVEEVNEILRLDEDDKLTTEQKLFLVAYATYGTVSQACRAVGVAPMTHKKWLKDEHYAEAFNTAFEVVTDKLEETSLRAALIVENVKERMFHLRARRPERYGVRKDEGRGGDGKVTLADIAREAARNGLLDEEDEE